MLALRYGAVDGEELSRHIDCPETLRTYLKRRLGLDLASAIATKLYCHILAAAGGVGRKTTPRSGGQTRAGPGVVAVGNTATATAAAAAAAETDGQPCSAGRGSRSTAEPAVVGVRTLRLRLCVVVVVVVVVRTHGGGVVVHVGGCVGCCACASQFAQQPNSSVDAVVDLNTTNNNKVDASAMFIHQKCAQLMRRSGRPPALKMCCGRFDFRCAARASTHIACASA